MDNEGGIFIDENLRASFFFSIDNNFDLMLHLINSIIIARAAKSICELKSAEDCKGERKAFAVFI